MATQARPDGGASRERSRPSTASSSDLEGAGGAYWDFVRRPAAQRDLGHTCRECKRPFTAIGEPLAERRGARLAMRYHDTCFSGTADPRTQSNSSFAAGKWAGAVGPEAPREPFRKMRTAQHFDR
mmetsp:Transcript_8641/g.29474  ORF Transcript_8641/g.29474 Transcript_8641/m.29474 type:complete len:125 (-) Transcript_8641:371-745(-)